MMESYMSGENTINSSTIPILKPFNKLPDLQTATVLLIGEEGVGKHSLAKALVSINTAYSLQIRTALSLPLPEDYESIRPRIDFVCFMVDLTSRESMKTVEKSLTHIDVKYFLGRSCLAALNVQIPEKRGVDIDAVTKLSDHYNLSVLYGSTQIDTECLSLARQILHMAEITSGFKKNVSPLLIEVCKVPYDIAVF